MAFWGPRLAIRHALAVLDPIDDDSLLLELQCACGTVNEFRCTMAARHDQRLAARDTLCAGLYHERITTTLIDQSQDSTLDD